MALISELRQRNTNNSTHWPGISKSVAMRIAYMVNSETPQNVRVTVPVDRFGFKKKFKCLKEKKIANVEST